MVTWEITPADSNTFVLSTGQTVFADGQEVADIVIEVSFGVLYVVCGVGEGEVCRNEQRKIDRISIAILPVKYF